MMDIQYTLPEGMSYVHEHDDWADGDCTRCLRLDTYLEPIAIR
jgi:hypothetical protein